MGPRSDYALRFRIGGLDRAIERSPIHFRSPGPPFALCSLGFFQDAIGLSRGRNLANGRVRLSWFVGRATVCKANANPLIPGRSKRQPFAKMRNDLN